LPSNEEVPPISRSSWLEAADSPYCRYHGRRCRSAASRWGSVRSSVPIVLSGSRWVQASTTFAWGSTLTRSLLPVG